jgi:hypothetical protein
MGIATFLSTSKQLNLGGSIGKGQLQITKMEDVVSTTFRSGNWKCLGFEWDIKALSGMSV